MDDRKARRLACGAVCAIASLTLSACAGPGISIFGLHLFGRATPAPIAPSASPTSSQGPAATPSPSPETGPSATPAPLSSPTASPTATPYDGPLADQFLSLVATGTSTGQFFCANETGQPAVATANLGLPPASGTTAYLPDAIQLGAVVQLSNGYCTGNVAWTSSNATVARVSNTGLVQTVSATGTAMITATTVAPTSYTAGAPSLIATASITVSSVGGADVTIQ